MNKTDFKRYLDEPDPYLDSVEATDWGKKRDNWLEAVDDFYRQITSYLDGLEKVEVTRSEVEIEEEYVGVGPGKIFCGTRDKFTAL